MTDTRTPEELAKLAVPYSLDHARRMAREALSQATNFDVDHHDDEEMCAALQRLYEAQLAVHRLVSQRVAARVATRRK